ncbi:Ankyrin_repeat protein 1 [Hexamita inflata]|uniref:Ankyrin repeat protein 1 n=1 Tax=Hexamita inflata TaxID=28002 RepID=A0AA86P1Q9_9EUKA|nr:Ankyrin repeat protein 1 [Hexamita inflata]
MGCGAVDEGLLKDWFEAARSGDIEFLNKYSSRCQTQVDMRDSAPEYGVYTGFSAIHYAIVCDQFEAVQELIDAEYFCRLPYDCLIVAPSIGPRAQFVLREGMNIQHLSFLVGNPKISEYILNYTHKSGHNLVGIPDSQGMFSVSVLFFIQTNDLVIRHLHSDLMEEEIQLDYTGSKPSPSHLHMSGLFGRYKLVEHLLDYIKSGVATTQFVERIYSLALKTHKYQTILDACKIPMDKKRCGTSHAERQRCLEAMEKLVAKALEYFEDNGLEQDLVENYKYVTVMTDEDKLLLMKGPKGTKRPGLGLNGSLSNSSMNLGVTSLSDSNPFMNESKSNLDVANNNESGTLSNRGSSSHRGSMLKISQKEINDNEE